MCKFSLQNAIVFINDGQAQISDLPDPRYQTVPKHRLINNRGTNAGLCDMNMFWSDPCENQLLESH